MGNTFGAKYWSWVVILGALWLAWWGLIRRRASRVAEGTIWMVLAMVALVWLIGRPSDFTTLGTKVSNGATAAFNAALPQSNANASACIPGGPGRPAGRAERRGHPQRQRAVGDAGLQAVADGRVRHRRREEQDRPGERREAAVGPGGRSHRDLLRRRNPNIDQKADDYKAVAKNIKNNYPGVYPLFQGKNWTSRLAVSFGALIAALVAGLLVLVIAVMLMVLKISFLLLLVAGPIFLGIGIHPGIGRVIAVRWFELLLSTLLKQAALIGVLALLLWALRPGHGREPAVGAADPAHLPRHARGVHLPQAVPAPVRLRRLLGRRLPQERGASRAGGTGDAQAQHGDRRRRRAGHRGLPVRPLGQARGRADDDRTEPRRDRRRTRRSTWPPATRPGSAAPAPPSVPSDVAEPRSSRPRRSAPRAGARRRSTCPRASQPPASPSGGKVNGGRSSVHVPVPAPGGPRPALGSTRRAPAGRAQRRERPAAGGRRGPAGARAAVECRRPVVRRRVGRRHRPPPRSGRRERRPWLVRRWRQRQGRPVLPAARPGSAFRRRAWLARRRFRRACDAAAGLRRAERSAAQERPGRGRPSGTPRPALARAGTAAVPLPTAVAGRRRRRCGPTSHAKTLRRCRSGCAL